MPESLSLAQQPKKQREQDADKQARRHWKIKPEVFSFYIDVTRQSSKPWQLATKREQRSEHNQRNPNPDQSFADVVHG
jgi:hypothetical protein